MAKLTSRDLQAIQTKKNIVRVCGELLEEKPWNEIKIADICKGAGISVGAFYYHFKNKEAILNTIDERMDHYFYDHVLQDCLQMPPQEGLWAYMSSQTQFYVPVGSEMFKNLYKAQLDNEHYAEELHTRYFIKGIRALLDYAVRQHCLPQDTDIEVLVHEILAVNYGIYYFWCLMGDQIDIDAYAKKIHRQYLSSLFAETL